MVEYILEGKKNNDNGKLWSNKLIFFSQVKLQKGKNNDGDNLETNMIQYSTYI